jgi:L-galactose dehydrogenase
VFHSSTARSNANSLRMQYRQLGRTDLVVSLVGYGASPLGDVFGNTDPKEAVRAVHLAIDEGINFFDVSPYYGRTLAEERLGAALEGRRSEVILATKCGRYGDAEFDFSANRVTRSLDDSLRRLRTDYVDLLQAHDVEFGDARQIIEETIPVMRRLQEKGKVRYIGITGYPLKVLVRIARAVPVDSILTYCRYNLLADDMDAFLMPFAREHGVGVINASGLHMGILTDRGEPDWHPAPGEVKRAGRQAAELCRQRGIDLAQLALRYCFEYPLVASTLVGMSTTDQVRRNIAAFCAPADPQLVREVRSILNPVRNHVWHSGRPENQDVNDGSTYGSCHADL